MLFSFLGGASGAIGFPAYQAMVPDLVPPDDLLGAVSLSSAQFNLGRVHRPGAGRTGPAVPRLRPGLRHQRGILRRRGGGADAGPVAEADQRRRTVGIVARIVIGARAAMSEPGCRAAMELIAIVALLASPFIALVPAMSGVLHRHGVSTPVATALLVTAQGIGAVAGALALPSLAERFGRRTMLQTSLFVLPVLLVVYGLAPTLWWSMVAFVAVGAGYIAVLSGLNTVVQLRAPAEVRGRILGIYMVGLGIVYPIGAVLQGWIGDHIGVRAVTVLGAVVLFGGDGRHRRRPPGGLRRARRPDVADQHGRAPHRGAAVNGAGHRRGADRRRGRGGPAPCRRRPAGGRPGRRRPGGVLPPFVGRAALRRPRRAAGRHRAGAVERHPDRGRTGRS